MANSVIYAMYDDDQTLISAAKDLVAKGIHVTECYSPFPIHGIDPIIGVKRTRLGIVAFMFGLGGLSLAMLGTWYFMISDWPMIIGGKPNFAYYYNMPSFVPILFEFTVFCAAHGMSLTYLIRNRTLPGMPAVNPDPRTTDDKFVIELDTEKNHGMSGDDLMAAVKQTGVYELNEKKY